MTGSTAQDLWVHWWCNPWRWAHPSWQQRFAEQQGIPMQACDSLMSSRHTVFLKSVGIEPSQPPEPVEPLMSWIALSPAQRDKALVLAQLICFSRTETEGVDGQWCWGLTKALRPGVWLAPEVVDIRTVLGAWLGYAYWSRLRLAWPTEAVIDDLCEAPDNKLQTLWQAVMWRISTA
ncbi:MULTISPECIES: hypothetical protein [Pseudomonas syringae group]|uniref:HrpD n=2 Tax=Pseudomonas syringae group TaxID=136849 RepID=I6LCS6_PSEVI|nr:MULTISPECIES: hypothetical protein [Pseudomonas syringae group]AAT96156.1 HrpD [Pseudomonas viridiflava]AAT96210.1 HrpD [Pseudomonas viridiflava]KPY37656.1 HrpD [Pseudomonas syringae pv. primulae]MBD8185881.1 type III secretion protein [Pseudomonas viridiflava]MBD8200694.1 type III secretion protein [Pseudomonas viridiflava]